MPAQFKLRNETSIALKTLLDTLRIEFDALVEQFEATDEDWREDEAGQQVDGWLEDLENLLTDGDNFQHNSVDHS